ncbi:hypothetical protein JS531_03035 [Bifidobacterium sp. CP2]|uniref:hypothetical protein n=1 Tax=Bifidobacterium sp. CP2 TaxID=2809025 RepID=UPI001BDCD8B2|nr:hypothetical protein [Bifidobacterium sp. CP2]MBT1180960.1 hypothetical protein [Bifidobacterium sp. CP2]
MTDDDKHDEDAPDDAPKQADATAPDDERHGRIGDGHMIVSGLLEGAAGRFHGLLKIAATLAVVALLGWVGHTGMAMGVASVDVTRTPQYAQRARDLRWAQSDLKESQEDVVNRTRDIGKANDAIKQADKDAATYQAVVDEFDKAGQASESPAITVTGIGERGASAGGYTTIPMTVHNNTSNTYTFYEVNFQVQDDAGNVRHAYFALGSSDIGSGVCGPNADCHIQVLDQFDYAGLTLVPISWSVSTADSSGNGYGTYGTDAPTRRF